MLFGLLKKIFIGLLTGIVGASNHTKCVSLRNIKIYDSTYSYQFTS